MKTILITGVNRGIGNAIAQEFLNNNWHVIGTVQDGNKEINLDSFENFQKETLDVSDFQSMDRLVEKIFNQSIDVLLNNAGVIDASSLNESIYDNEHSLMNVYLVNTISPYIFAEKLSPQILRGSDKLVVSVSSLLSKIEHMLPQHWVYGSSKTSLNYAMKAFARNYPKIKVALVRPGWVRTDMGGENAPLGMKEAAQIIYNNIEHYNERLPANAMVGPENDITFFLKQNPMQVA